MGTEDLFRQWSEGKGIVSIDKPLNPDDIPAIVDDLFLALIEADRNIKEEGAKYEAEVTLERDEGNNLIKGRLEISTQDGEGESFSVNKRPGRTPLLIWFSSEGKPFINSTVAVMRAKQLLKKIT